MNEQTRRVVDLIYTVKEGLPGAEQAVSELRNICHRVADMAPVDDLVKIVEFLVEMRKEAARQRGENWGHNNDS